MLTTRDCAALIRQAGLDLPSLPDSPYDDFLGLGSGAAALFGTTGGVMEAAVRRAQGATQSAGGYRVIHARARPYSL